MDAVLRYVVAVSFTALLVSSAQAAPGDLDPTFGSLGLAGVAIGGNSLVYDMATQADGKIVVVGAMFNTTAFDGATFAVARFDPNGALDGSFGVGGVVTTPVGMPTTCCDILDTLANAVAIQADGKILVAGHALVDFGPDIDAALVRYNPDGSLDSTFGTAGVVLEPAFDSFEDVAVLSDGRILAAAAGLTYVTHAGVGALACYDSTGVLDATFGVGGLVSTPRLRALLLLDGGDFLAAGGIGAADASDFWIGRFNPDGSPDLGFGTGGAVNTDFGASEIAQAIALSPGGDIVAGGSALFNDPFEETQIKVARYDAGGNLDVGFDGDGMVQRFVGVPLPLPVPPFVLRVASVNAVLVQADDSILVGGSVANDFYGFSVPYVFTLTRLSPDGGTDTTFNAFGSGSIGAISAMAFQPNTVVVAGWSGSYLASTPLEFGLARHVLDADVGPVCGDGNVDLDEECDDGNLVAGDCCSPGCRFEVVGTICGPLPESCVVADTCDGAGSCIIGGPAPRTGCKSTVAQKASRFVLLDGANARLSWRWRGEETLRTDLADPVSGDDYALCLFAGGTLAAITAPGGGECAGKPCWRNRSQGPRYDDPDSNNDGVRAVSLRSGGEGKSLIVVKGKGAALPIPALPLSLPLTVQLQAENGACFEAVFDGVGVRANDATRFVGRSVVP